MQGQKKIKDIKKKFKMICAKTRREFFYKSKDKMTHQIQFNKRHILILKMLIVFLIHLNTFKIILFSNLFFNFINI